MNNENQVKLAGSFDAKLAAAIYKAVAVSDPRWYLCGIHITPHPEKGVIMLATNGHYGAMAYDENGHISRPATLKFDKPFLSKHKKTRGSFLERKIGIDGNYVCIYESPQGEIEIRPGSIEAVQVLDELDGKYPADRLIDFFSSPRMPITGFVSVNANYLSVANSVFNTYSKNKWTPVVINQLDYGNAGEQYLLAPHSNDVPIAFLIMSMRMDEQKDGNASWINSLKKPESN